MSDLKSQIRELAAAHDFGLCGFAAVQPPPHLGFFEAWVAAGMAADMGYLGAGLAKRGDPSRLLAGARTVITLGSRYLPPALPAPDWQTELSGRIAAYALGTDYHRTIEKRLKRLAAAIGELRPTAELRWYVDTGPILEREWAALGGIGWFGKNTMILHREQGSWFFLAELLTNLELEPDAPTSDHCGTCTSCIDRCPTAALRPGYELDARLCISYWTIEHRGWLPVEMRGQMGNWVFGCDVCQDVCPWNDKLMRHSQPTRHAALYPSLLELVRLDEAGFRERYRGSAVLRTKREGLVRNAAVALGNSGNQRAVPALCEALNADPSAVVRGHAAWALGRLGGGDAGRALATALDREVDEQVRAEIEAARKGK